MDPNAYEFKARIKTHPEWTGQTLGQIGATGPGLLELQKLLAWCEVRDALPWLHVPLQKFLAQDEIQKRLARAHLARREAGRLRGMARNRANRLDAELAARNEGTQ